MLKNINEISNAMRDAVLSSNFHLRTMIRSELTMSFSKYVAIADKLNFTQPFKVHSFIRSRLKTFDPLGFASVFNQYHVRQLTRMNEVFASGDLRKALVTGDAVKIKSVLLLLQHMVVEEQITHCEANLQIEMLKLKVN